MIQVVPYQIRKALLAIGPSLLLIAAFPASAAEGEVDDSNLAEDPYPAASADEAPSPVAATEQSPQEQERAGDAWIDFVYGFGDLETGHQIAEEVSAYSILVGTSYDLGDLDVGLRFPFSSATFETEGGGRISQTALGNIEAFASAPSSLGEHTELAFEVAFALPSAEGDPLGGQTDARLFAVQQAASAARGLEETTLFTPNFFGIIPRLALTYRTSAVHFALWEQVDLELRTSARKTSKTTDSNAKAVASLSGADSRFYVIPQLWAGIRIWAHYAFSEAFEPVLTEGASEPSRLQIAMEPGIGARIGSFQPHLGYIAPIGGPLGDPGYHGARLSVHLVF